MRTLSIAGLSGRARRRQRGLAIFSALMALGLFGLMLITAIRYVDEWSYAQRHASAAGELVVLAQAARAHAASDLDAMRTATGSLGLNEIDIDTLIAQGWLLDGFRRTNALGQTYRVFHRRVGTDGLDVLVTTVTPAGRTVGYRAGVGYEGGREIFVGVVDPGALDPADAGRLMGPAIDADVSAYRARYAEPSIGETAALTGLSLRSIYASELHRLPVAGRPEANRMETTLAMGGNDIVGAARIESVEALVADELEVLGGVEVLNELRVGQRLRVSGVSTFEGNLEAADGVFAGAVTSNTAVVANEARAQTLTVSGDVTAATVRATVAMTAPDVTATDVTAADVVAGEVRSDDIEAREVTGHVVRGGTVRGDSGVFRQVHTGGCSGC